MLCLDKPILWKKCPTTIWNPTNGAIITIKRIPSSDNEINVGSSVKSMIVKRGKNSFKIKDTHITIVANMMLYFTTLTTRSYCWEP